MKPKNEIEVVEYTRDKKIADPNSLVLDGDREIETPLPTKQESPPQEPIETEKFCWHRDRGCIVVDHQPTIAIYWNQNDGITSRQEDFYGYGDSVVHFRPEFAEKIAKAILALARGAI